MTGLQAWQQLKREWQQAQQQDLAPLSESDRQMIRDLADDLPALWHAPTTTNVERKQLLRYLIRDVTLIRRKETLHIAIRWQTDAVTELEILPPKRVYDTQRTSADVIARVHELAPTHSHSRIAEVLNEEGLTTGAELPFSRPRVYWVRFSNHVPTGCPLMSAGRRSDDRYSSRAAAELPNVDHSTIALWCRSGKLSAIQDAPFSAYWIELTPETIAKLRKPARQRRP